MEYGIMPGRYPAIVKSYSQAKRTCRVEIPGLTDGGDVMPEAEIEYPIGDKSKAGAHSTEIEIVPGDTVWVAFIGGDPRYPIITGWRNPQTGNSTDWRRWHHANMELLADTLMKLIAGGNFLIKSGATITVEAGGELNVTAVGAVTVNTDADATVTAKGKATIKAASIDLNAGAMKGLVQGDCACAFTGLPHGQVSATVKGSV